MKSGRHGGSLSPADISVIIPVSDRAELLRRCLKAVAASDAAPREVIVVIDAALDLEVGQVAAESSGVRVIHLPFPVGPASARNAGALVATGSILLFIDADVEIRPGTIEQVADEFRAHPDASAIIGSYDDEPSELDVVSQYRNLRNHFAYQQASPEAINFWGACGAIRANVFTAIGGFEPGHRLEDVELGCRLRRGGHRVRMCPQLLVKHLKKWTLPSMFRADLFYRAIPWTRVMLKYGDLRSTELNLGWSHRLSTLFAFITPALLITAIPWHPALAIALVTGALWLRVNAAFLHFLEARRGRWFALRSIPIHWVHSVVAGLGFIIGALLHCIDRSSAGSLRPADGSAEDPTGDLHV